jgi:hypothetical protein
VVDIHPLADFEVVQRVVPLGVEMDVFSNAPIAGERTFVIEQATVDGVVVEDLQPIRELFAPGQHFDIGTGDAAVTRPSFELFDAGVRLSSPDVLMGASLATNFEYEEIVVNERISRPSFRRIHLIAAASTLAGAKNGAVASTLRSNGSRYLGPRHAVEIVEAGFTAASVEGIVAHSLGGGALAEDASYTEVLRAIERHVAEQPEARGRVQVVRRHEMVSA